MKKKCLADKDCPVARGYNAIGDWWSLLIVAQILNYGHRRFGEMQDSLGMAKNILTARLSKLMEEGIIQKAPCADGSAYHEYVATERGRDLFKVIVALRQWGEKHYFECGDLKYAVVDRQSGESVPPIEVRSADGRVLGPDDMEIIRHDPAESAA